MTDGPRPLTLRDLAEGLRSPATPAQRRRFDAPLRPASALHEHAQWLAGARGVEVPGPLERVTLLVLAGDHGVAGRDVSRWAPGDTSRQVEGLRDGSHPAAALAAAAGVRVDVRALSLEGAGEDGTGAGPDVLQRASGDVAVEDAMSAEQTEAALRAGAALADAEADAGTDLVLLGGLGRGATAVAAVLVAVCLRKGAVDVVGRGSGVDDDTWMRKAAAVRDGVRRGRKLATRPTAMLAAVGSPDLAAATGFLLRAAARRTPVLLDGVTAAAAALVASRGVPGAEQWWRVAARTGEPAQHLAAERLKLTPLLDLGGSDGAGTTALAALGLLRAAQQLAAAEAALLPEPEHEHAPAVAEGEDVQEPTRAPSTGLDEESREESGEESGEERREP